MAAKRKKYNPNRAVNSARNHIISNMYIASSSAHTAPYIFGLDKINTLVSVDKVEQLSAVVLDSLNNVSRHWMYWVVVFVKCSDDVVRTDITEVTLPNMTQSKIDHAAKDIVTTALDAVDRPKDIVGFGWCAFPNTEFDTDANEQALLEYFYHSGAADPARSNINITVVS